jgi:hypothetical protein
MLNNLNNNLSSSVTHLTDTEPTTRTRLVGSTCTTTTTTTMATATVKQISETRISDKRPAAEDCANLYISAAGHWLAENNALDRVDICLNNFESSYEFPTNDYAGDAYGYTAGVDYENGRIISGRWVEANGAMGVSIGYRTRSVLTNLVWSTSHASQRLDPSTTPTVFRFVRTGTPEFCNRNKYLLRPYVGSAHVLLPGIAVLVSLVITALFHVVL